MSGQNHAPVSRWFIPVFIGFHASQLGHIIPVNQQLVDISLRDSRLRATFRWFHLFTRHSHMTVEIEHHNDCSPKSLQGPSPHPASRILRGHALQQAPHVRGHRSTKLHELLCSASVDWSGHPPNHRSGQGNSKGQ